MYILSNILSLALVLCLCKSLFRVNELLNITGSMLLMYRNIIKDVFSLFIKSIVKSLVILAIWLALSGAICSWIALSFALNLICFSANERKWKKKAIAWQIWLLYLYFQIALVLCTRSLFEIMCMISDQIALIVYLN